MQSSTLFRAGAFVTASALALSLGAGTGPAPAAAETTAASAPTATTEADQSSITRIVVNPAALHKRGNNIIGAKVTVVGAAPRSVTSTLSVDGVPKADVTIFPDAVYLKNTVGTGTARLGTLTIVNHDGTVSTAPANSPAFRIRTTVKGQIWIKHRGSRLTFRVRARTFVPATAGAVSLRRVTVQHRSGSVWRNVKIVRLNSSGYGGFTKRTSTKRRYRIVVPTTQRVLGATSSRAGKV